MAAEKAVESAEIMVVMKVHCWVETMVVSWVGHLADWKAPERARMWAGQ